MSASRLYFLHGPRPTLRTKKEELASTHERPSPVGALHQVGVRRHCITGDVVACWLRRVSSGERSRDRVLEVPFCRNSVRVQLSVGFGAGPTCHAVWVWAPHVTVSGCGPPHVTVSGCGPHMSGGLVVGPTCLVSQQVIVCGLLQTTGPTVSRVGHGSHMSGDLVAGPHVTLSGCGSHMSG